MASALRGGAQTAHTTPHGAPATPRRRPELRVGGVGCRPCNRSTRFDFGLPHATPRLSGGSSSARTLPLAWAPPHTTPGMLVSVC